MYQSLIFSDHCIKQVYRFHGAAGLFSNRSQRKSKCGKNISDNVVKTSLFPPHFEVICNLLLKRRTAT